jgi:uncharacterized membrane protein
MQEVQNQTETESKCCGNKGRHRRRHHGGCGASHEQEAGAASALEILQQRFARGEIDAAEFQEKRRVITSA